MSSRQASFPNGTPAAEIAIDIALVKNLLAEQHPDLAQLPIQPMDAGWDNAMFRLGEQFVIRLPRRAAAAALIKNEQTWLPLLVPHLSLPVPTPYRIGQPAPHYPWHWSIVPWFAGSAADQQAPHENQAQSFAAFLRSLHIPAPINAPENKVRGVPLSHRAAVIAERMQRLATKTNLITAEIIRIWNQALAAPIDVQPRWLHGDLHTRNILVERGVITAIIDWGDMTAGDVATDLAAIWMLFAQPQARAQALSTYANISEATLHRAKGWAVLFGVILLETGLVDNPRHAAMGEKTLRRVAEF